MIMAALIYLILMFTWMAGVVIAQGFWSTFFAIFFVPWSYYLVVEHLLTKYLL